MQVIVRDRGEGKSTELVKWLYEGKQQEGYPGWSRVIVCTTRRSVMFFDGLVKQASVRYNFHSCDRMLPHTKADCEFVQTRMMADIRKAVWSLRDFKFCVAGRRDFEFAVDDFDQILEEFFAGRQPTLIAMTGELHNG